MRPALTQALALSSLLAIWGTSQLAQADSTGLLTLDSAPVTKESSETSSSTVAPYFLSLYFENDGTFVRPGGSDKHYTSAEGFSFAWQSQFARDFGAIVPSFWDEFNPSLKQTSFAFGITAAQDIYTPTDLTQTAPIFTDRPYAGWLYGGVFWQRAVEPVDSHATFEHLEVDLGTVGPASLSEKAQKFIHTHLATDAEQPQGWDNQINDEVGFNLTYLRKWRFDLVQQTEDGMPAIQVIPKTGFTVGTISRNAQADLLARIGWNLPDDFGPGRLHEVASYTTQKAPYSPFGMYFFGRVGGELVEHNTFLEGNNFRSSTVTVDEYPMVGEIQVGVAVQLLKHVEVVYAQTMRSKEFHGQEGWDGYGALSLTFAWNF